MREDFLELKKYYKEAANRLPIDSFFKQSIDHKFKHSVRVLRVGEYIMNGEPELKYQSDNFKNIARKALLFHDVGRFEEAVKRYHTPVLRADAQTLNQYDHGLIGYQKLKNNPLYNDIRILLAVRYHSKMMDEVKRSSLWFDTQKSRYATEAEEILYLVRDADKLALLEDMKYEGRLKKDLFFKLLSKEALESGLSEKAKQQFFAGQTILSSAVYSFADRILMVMSWMFDLNYSKTKEMFKQQEYAQYFLEMLRQCNIADEEIDNITNFAYQNM